MTDFLPPILVPTLDQTGTPTGRGPAPCGPAPSAAAAATGAFEAVAQQTGADVAEDLRQLLAWGLRADLVGVVEPLDDGASLRVEVRYHGQVDHPRETMSCLMPVDAERSLGGYCRLHQQVVYARCLWNDVRFRDRVLLEQNMSTALAAPLMQGSTWRGAILVATRTPRNFGVGDALFLNSLATLWVDSVCQAAAAPERLAALSGEELSAHAALVMAIDAAGAIVQASRACTALLAPAGQSLNGQLFSDVALADAAQFHSALGRHWAGQAVTPWTTQPRTADQRSRVVEWRLASPLSGAQQRGAERTVLVIGRDLTSRVELQRLAEARRAESAERSLHLAEPGMAAERRIQPRTAFPQRQLIAASADGELPPRHEFHEVQCRDISSEGFSFLWPAPWEPEQLLVAFDSGHRFAHLVASVAHNTPVQGDDGRTEYIIGCRFVGHIAE